MSEQGAAEQSEIADQFQRFVTAALVGHAQAAGVQNTVACEADGIVERGAANEPHIAHLPELILETEGAGGRDLGGIAVRGHFQLQRLAADQRMREIGFAREAEAFGRQDADAFAAVFHAYRTANPQVAPLAAVLADARLPDQLDKGLPAAIEDGDFEIIDLDVSVVDPHGIEHAQQMLGGREQHAFAHQTRGIAHARHMTPAGGDRKIVEIRTKKYNAGGYGRRKDPDMDRNTAVQADAARLDRALNRGLKFHAGSPA